MKQVGWDDITGKKVLDVEVVGVMEDFHFKDLYNEIGGLMIQNGKNVSHISIRLNQGNITKTLKQVKVAFHEVLPDFIFEYEFYDDYFDGLYKQEQKRASTIKIIAIIAIFITCIGLFGSVEFSTKTRIKEIGIRKVNGAKVYQIMLLLNKNFAKWFVIAFIIACPIAYYILDKWLANFQYKISISWWFFLLSGVIVFTITFLTVSWRTRKAAVDNPVNALRYE
jgi:putative ABC transport system permease protein